MLLSEKIEESNQILKEAIQKYNPCVLLAGLSGGGDSMTILYLLKELGYEFAPFHCNTGIGIEKTRVFVRDVCKGLGLDLIEEKSTDKSYEEIVLDIGFPGAGQHQSMYSMLKERAIRQIVRRYDPKRNMAIITGVRKSESGRRKINIKSAIQKDGRKYWISPIMNWDDDDKEEFLQTRLVPTNPVSKCMGMSGECLCGAYAQKGELKKVREVEPETYQYIKDLEKRVKAKGFTWGWEDQPPKGMEYLNVMEKVKPGYKERYLEKMVTKMQKKTGQTDLFFQPLCTGCNHKNAINEQKKKYLNNR